MAMVWKILFHKHLEKIANATLWRWLKGLVIAFVAMAVIPDCVPFLEEATLAWMAISVAWELVSRGEIDLSRLPAGVRKRLPGAHDRMIDVEPKDESPVRRGR